MYQNINLIKRINKMTNKVLLTGISGWIAKHTAIELLNAGYEVLGTVRNNTLIEQTKETIGHHAPIDNLSFVELDLLKDDGWVEAAKDCKYIMHLASPFPFKVSNNRNSLLAPAVDGTLRVLNAGLNADVEQFIVTSSIAVCFAIHPLIPVNNTLFVILMFLLIKFLF
jgi:dihydroflavonol-4-reductase